MRIFLTGASGFVGANIARRLLKEGHEVHINLRKGSNSWRLGEILRQLNTHMADLRNLNDITKTINVVKPEAIIHLATYGAYPTLQKDLQKILDTNYTGTLNLVRACDQIRYEIFINTSSSSEYGLVKKAMNEEDFPKPIDYYGAAKTAATVFCQTHARITGAPIVTTRLFSVYGPYEEPVRLVPSTIKKCLLNEKLEFTQGMQKRDFIFTSDIEDAYLSLLGRPDLKGEILNMGTGSQHSVRDIVSLIIKETGTSSKPSWGAIPTRQFESFNWVADVEKTHRVLKWKAKVELSDGIGKTVAWMRENLHHYEGNS